MPYTGLKPKSSQQNQVLSTTKASIVPSMTWQSNSLKGTSNLQLLVIHYLLFIKFLGSYTLTLEVCFSHTTMNLTLFLFLYANGTLLYLSQFSNLS